MSPSPSAPSSPPTFIPPAVQQRAVLRLLPRRPQRPWHKLSRLTWGTKPEISALSLLSSSLAALLSLFPATGLHFHLKQYLESCTGADEMGSFVRVRPQCMACGFDRLDTSKQTARLACGSVCVCICVCLIYAHVFLAHWPPGHQALCTDVWGTTRKLSSIPFLRIAHET